MNFDELDQKMRIYEQSLDQQILPEIYMAARIESADRANGNRRSPTAESERRASVAGGIRKHDCRIFEMKDMCFIPSLRPRRESFFVLLLAI